MDEIIVSAREKEELAAQIAELEQQCEQARAEKKLAGQADGDKSENSSLDIAEQTLLSTEKQLKQARDRYERAVVQKDIDTSSVGLLTKVTLINEVDNSELVVVIVDEGQAGPPNRVSRVSLMGQALIGYSVGDNVQYQDNQFRVKKYIIKKIEADN